MAAMARRNGAHVIEGYFPNALPPEERFDVITFNDVFEHLPDFNRMVENIRAHLTSGGILVINIPVSEGAVFRLSRAAARLGLKGPLARMWQQGLPSPHLSYFSTSTLTRLMERHGLKLVKSGPLTSIVTDGFYERIRADKAVSPVRAGLTYAAGRTLAYFGNALPSDIHFFAFKFR
jgi:SAM-dependent methyltransferase